MRGAQKQNKKRTVLIKMVGFLVTNLFVASWPPRFRPPLRCFLVTSGVWMVGLFLWFHGLHPCFCYHLAGGLLAVSEPLVVKLPHLIRAGNFDAPFRRRNGTGGIIVGRLAAEHGAPGTFPRFEGKAFVVKDVAPVVGTPPFVSPSSARVMRPSGLTVVVVLEAKISLFILCTCGPCNSGVSIGDRKDG